MSQEKLSDMLFAYVREHQTPSYYLVITVDFLTPEGSILTVYSHYNDTRDGYLNPYISIPTERSHKIRLEALLSQMPEYSHITVSIGKEVFKYKESIHKHRRTVYRNNVPICDVFFVSMDDLIDLGED